MRLGMRCPSFLLRSVSGFTEAPRVVGGVKTSSSDRNGAGTIRSLIKLPIASFTGSEFFGDVGRGF